MTLTNVSPTTPIARIPLPQKLLDGHPAHKHFAITVKHFSLETVTIEFQWLTPSTDSGNIYSLLGCIVDCAARLAAQPIIGACMLLEQELHVSAPSSATTLQVSAQIDSSSTRYAIYQCTVYALEPEDRRLLADSQGTLLKRSAPAPAQKDGNP